MSQNDVEYYKNERILIENKAKCEAKLAQVRACIVFLDALGDNIIATPLRKALQQLEDDFTTAKTDLSDYQEEHLNSISEEGDQVNIPDEIRQMSEILKVKLKEFESVDYERLMLREYKKAISVEIKRLGKLGIKRSQLLARYLEHLHHINNITEAQISVLSERYRKLDRECIDLMRDYMDALFEFNQGRFKPNTEGENSPQNI